MKNDGPKIMADIFHFLEKPYNLRNNPIIQLVLFNGVLKDETLNPPSCHFIIFS